MSGRHEAEVENLLSGPEPLPAAFLGAKLMAFAIALDVYEGMAERMATSLEAERFRPALSLTPPNEPAEPSKSAERARQWREKRRVRERTPNAETNGANAETNAANAVNERGEQFGVARSELPRDASTAKEGTQQGYTPQEPPAGPPLFGETDTRSRAVRERPANAEPNAETNAANAFANAPPRSEIEEVWQHVTAFITDDDDVAWLQAFRGEVSAVKGLEAGDQLGRRLWDLLRDDVSDAPKYLPVHLRLVRNRDQKRLIERSVESVVAALKDVKRQQELQDELTTNVARQTPLFDSVRHAIEHGRPPAP